MRVLTGMWRKARGLVLPDGPRASHISKIVGAQKIRDDGNNGPKVVSTCSPMLMMSRSCGLSFERLLSNFRVPACQLHQCTAAVPRPIPWDFGSDSLIPEAKTANERAPQSKT